VSSGGKTLQNKFCKALSNAVSFRIPGDSNSLTFNPCCLYDDYLPYHPAFFKKRRQQFIEADQYYLPGCSKCELKEKTHGFEKTQRHIFNQQIPDGIDDEIYKLEIVLDTTCNAACIECGDSQSSLWRLERAKAAAQGKIFHIQPEPQIDGKIEIIKQNIDLQKVKRFHFWGGEPLITDTHLKFIEQIEDLSTVSLAYTTNGSVFPDDKVLELWSKCEEVVVGISTDGVGDRFHYCRWPLKWDKWARNTLKFKNETSDNVRFHVNYCVMPMNAWYTDEMDNWLKDNFNFHRDGSKINFNFIRSEGTVDANCTPMSLREEVWKKLGEDHIVSSILKELPVESSIDMINHLEYWDSIRKLDWRQIFPESAKHFK
jgi:sulfatase maturation enzyme AslB (radical SAM superfamily)